MIITSPTTIMILAFAYTFSAQVEVTEAKLRRFPQHPTVLPQFNTEGPLDGGLVVPQTKDSPLSILAEDFDQAMMAMNLNEEDIHVGHLLTACEKLSSTIRELGFVSSANDMANNIAKIRNTYEKLPSTQRDSMPVLLKYEQDVGITETDRINDASATMGLLWLGRSINYQYDMFQYILENPEASPYDAASHAYSSTVKPHLSWPLQRLGQAALNGLRSLQKQTILAHMGGFDEEEYTMANDCVTKQGMRRVLKAWNPIIQRWNQVLTDMGIGSL